MGSIKDALAEVSRAGADVAAAETARRALVEVFDKDSSPEASHAVADALWRLGLTTLLHGRQLDAAMDLFKRAVDKKDPEITPHARTSYALCLHAKGKAQQAIFELRKAVGTGAPTSTSAHALNLLCLLLRDQKAKPSEIEKADKERITALQTLHQGAPAGSEDAAHWALQLALAHKDGGSRSECTRLLEEVVAMGPAAGTATLETARTTLKQMKG